MRIFLPIFLFLVFQNVYCTQTMSEKRYQRQEPPDFISNLLASMTLRQKIGQMTQLQIGLFLNSGTYDQLNQTALKIAADWNVGSILNSPFANGYVNNGYAFNASTWRNFVSSISKFWSNGTPLLYGLDSVHGANYVLGATLFPHNLGSAATFDPSLVQEAARITAKDTRLSGVPWAFSPVLGIGVHPLWPRIYETFGEDPYLASQMGVAMVTGLQGDLLASNVTVASCIKHYLGYPDPTSGKDRSPAWIPERMVRRYFLPPFAAGVKAGAASLMINSAEINGIPLHTSTEYLTHVLRGELKFPGVAVSDWNDIQKLHTVHRVAATQREAVKMAVNAGVDMSMVPSDYTFSTLLLDLVQSGEVPMSRIDQSVTRILQLKAELGLFTIQNSTDDLSSIGSKIDREVALNLAREGITLLKNDGILPISPSTKNVLVVGPCGNSLVNQNGGWSIFWQGANNDSQFPFGSTIFQGVKSVVQPLTNVRYIEGVTFTDVLNLTDAINWAKQSDVVIACVGEAPEAETLGNINDLTLSDSQLTLLRAMESTGTPTVIVLVEARPRLLLDTANGANAILMAYLPGSEGGQAIAEILFGKVNPSGRLPLVYPSLSGDVGVPYYHKYSAETSPLYNFGYGLSYTTFNYSNIQLNTTSITVGNTLGISINVTNTGNMRGKETILLYLSDLYASITPEVKMLKRFTKVELNPNEKILVSFTLTTDDMTFIGINNQPVLEAGDFVLQIGSSEATFNVYFQQQPSTTDDPLVFQTEADFIAGVILVFIALGLVTYTLWILYTNTNG